MRITFSLYSALLHLRKTDTALMLWVDAICTYSGRSSIKNLRNQRSFILHPKELNRDSLSTENSFTRNLSSFIKEKVEEFKEIPKLVFTRY